MGDCQLSVAGSPSTDQGLAWRWAPRESGESKGLDFRGRGTVSLGIRAKGSRKMSSSFLPTPRSGFCFPRPLPSSIFCSMNKYYVVWCSLLFDMKKGNSLGWRRKGRETPFFTRCIKHGYPDLNSQKSNKTVKIMIKQLLADSCAAHGNPAHRAPCCSRTILWSIWRIASQLLNSVAGFCLGDSPSVGPGVALQKLLVSSTGGFLAPGQPFRMVADSGHAEELGPGQRSRLLTSVPNQIVCSAGRNGGRFSMQPSGCIIKGTFSTGMSINYYRCIHSPELTSSCESEHGFCF